MLLRFLAIACKIITDSSSKSVDNKPIASRERKIHLKCPRGYKLKVGYAPGDGLKRYSSSLEKCTHDCNAKTKCKAFQYSEKTSSTCKLLAVDKPINIPFKDFIFCKKEGILTFGTTIKLR